MRRVMGDHLECLGYERPPHSGLDVLIDFLDSSAGFFLSDQLYAWQDSSMMTSDKGLFLGFHEKMFRGGE